MMTFILSSLMIATSMMSFACFTIIGIYLKKKFISNEPISVMIFMLFLYMGIETIISFILGVYTYHGNFRGFYYIIMIGTFTVKSYIVYLIGLQLYTQKYQLFIDTKTLKRKGD